MSDPYRPAYYEGAYASQDQHAGGYDQHPAQHQLQLSQSHYPPSPRSSLAPPPVYSYPPTSSTHNSRSTSTHSHRRHHHHRSHSGHSRGSSRSRSSSSSRGDKKRTVKAVGATLAGAAGGGVLGHELGGGTLGTLGGVLAGAIGASALERRHERHKHPRSRRASLTDDNGSHHGHGLRDKLTEFLSPGGEERRSGEDRRSQSHTGGERRKEERRRDKSEDWVEDRRGGRW